ncbi:MAG: hypothetical protein ABI818_20270 [Acidobacteriota bacterium]
MDTDPLLRRVETTALVLCGVMAVTALAVTRGAPGPAFAVIAGGLLTLTSYWSIKLGLSSVLPANGAVEGGPVRAPRGRLALQLAGRYALLGFLGYVMIARLRLHPVALLAGASSFVAAVAVEAVRLFVKKS